MSRICEIEVVQLALPLTVPYKLSYRTFTEFEPYLVQVRTTEGEGIGEGHVSPGSSSETREGAWQFLKEHSERFVGMSRDQAMSLLEAEIVKSPVAATALMVALQCVSGHRLLDHSEALRLPLLSPVNGDTPDALHTELEERINEGFRCFKVKVGKDVDADIKRLGLIQSIVDGRATLRTDANRAYSVADAKRFATSIDPAGVELFEQPCHADDWDGNAAVAAVSNVPVMLDEPICSVADIDRAAGIKGVGYCKVKLKRFGGLDQLYSAIRHIQDRGMQAVLGDGLGAEIACWMEACVARNTIDNAGEFNGYLKASDTVLEPALGFDDGCLVAPPAFTATPDAARLSAMTQARFVVSD